MTKYSGHCKKCLTYCNVPSEVDTGKELLAAYCPKCSQRLTLVQKSLEEVKKVLQLGRSEIEIREATI